MSKKDDINPERLEAQQKFLCDPDVIEACKKYVSSSKSEKKKIIRSLSTKLLSTIVEVNGEKKTFREAFNINYRAQKKRLAGAIRHKFGDKKKKRRPKDAMPMQKLFLTFDQLIALENLVVSEDGERFFNSVGSSAFSEEDPLDEGVNKKYADQGLIWAASIGVNFGDYKIDHIRKSMAVRLNEYRIDILRDNQLRMKRVLDSFRRNNGDESKYAFTAKNWYSAEHEKENNLPNDKNPAYAKWLEDEAKRAEERKKKKDNVKSENPPSSEPSKPEKAPSEAEPDKLRSAVSELITMMKVFVAFVKSGVPDIEDKLAEIEGIVGKA